MSDTTLLNASTGYGLLLGFSVLWIALGVHWGRRAGSYEGYMVAGRNVGLALGTATAVATWVTSNTTMLAPQFAIQMGVWGMLAYSSASLGLFMFAGIAGRIRRLMPTGYTSGEFVRLRYGRIAWVAFLVISLFYSMTWMISMGMAGGLLLEALSGIPYVTGMSAILAVCVIYTLFGGLYAVIGTDFVQSIIILIGAIAVAVAVVVSVPLDAVWEHTRDHRPALLDVLFPAALMAFFNNLLFGIGEVFHSNVWWARAFAMREGVGPRAYALAGLIWLPIPITAGFVALAAPMIGVDIVRPDMIGPIVAGTVLGEVGALVVFIVVFASIASSVDSLLAATSQLVTVDVYQQVIGRDATPERLRKVAGAVIIVMGLLTWLVCLPRIGTLATVLFFAGPLVGSTLWPILAGLYWRATNPTGATAAMILGSGSGVVAYFAVGWYTATLVGTAVSMATVLLTTWFAPRPFEWSRLRGAEARGEPVR